MIVYCCQGIDSLLLLSGNTKAKLLDQPIPANFLKMEEAVRHLAVSCRHESESPVLKEQLFR